MCLCLWLSHHGECVRGQMTDEHMQPHDGPAVLRPGRRDLTVTAGFTWENFSPRIDQLWEVRWISENISGVFRAEVHHGADLGKRLDLCKKYDAQLCWKSHITQNEFDRWKLQLIIIAYFKKDFLSNFCLAFLFKLVMQAVSLLWLSSPKLFIFNLFFCLSLTAIL